MTRKKTVVETGRKRFSAEFKQQALLRAVKEGVPTAARELGLAPSQLYAWRAHAQAAGVDAEVQRVQQAEALRLKREVARLEEEVAFLKKAAAYFAKPPK